MNDSMKRPPMQQDAERLAAQGRFGDTMLVHMNPKEVQGIASLMPGGRLTTNPVTGQPEAFLPALLAIGAKVAPFVKGAIAAKGVYDAVKGPKGTGQTAARRQGQAARLGYGGPDPLGYVDPVWGWHCHCAGVRPIRAFRGIG